MVYRRVSTGCDECRYRHTKCDGVSPSCGRCLRRNIVCPGYRHTGGFVFKNPVNCTTASRTRAQLQKTISSDPKQTCSAGSKGLDHFIAFFFGTYVFSGRHNQASCGFFDNASEFCRQALPSSSLSYAAAMLGATTFLLSRRMDSHDFSWYHEIRHRAIASLQADIKCESTRLHDDTLMAVLLHDFTQAIGRAHMNTRLPLTHQDGAIILLKLRGARNFETKQAVSLYHAARYATLRGCTRSAQVTATLHTLDALANLDKIHQPPALQLLDLLDKLAELEYTLENATTRGQAFDVYYNLMIEMQESLDDWVLALPSEWLPRAISIPSSLPGTDRVQVERHACMDTAVLFNLWRCANLKMVRLRQLSWSSTITSPALLNEGIEQIFDGIQRAIPVFLGLLREPKFVEQDSLTGVWKEGPVSRRSPDMQRFPGDNLGKWLLSDLLERLDQIIGHHEDILPQLPVSDEIISFLREQKQQLHEMSPRTPQLGRIFVEVVA